MIRTVVIDDDEMTRKILVSYIERHPDLILSGEFENAIDALSILQDKNIDMFLLDVEMPEMTGFEFLSYNDNKHSQVIMVTSKEKYAVQAFEYNIADYLLKPIDYARFLTAVRKVKENLEALQATGKSSNALFVKEENVYSKLELSQIKWIEASGDYVSIVSEESSNMVHTTMKVIERYLPENEFVRVHRSYIINVNKLNNFDKDFCVVNKKMIPIGKSYRKELLSRLNVI